MKSEISYDLVMHDDIDFVEGCFRLRGGDWQVFIFSKRITPAVTWKMSIWQNKTKGVVFQVPASIRLNKEKVEALLSRVFGVAERSEVRGPNSIVLR